MEVTIKSNDAHNITPETNGADTAQPQPDFNAQNSTDVTIQSRQTVHDLITAAQKLNNTMNDSNRNLPSAIEAERSLLSYILLDPSAMEQISYENLKAEDFFDSKYANIYHHMTSLHARDLPINTVTLMEELSNKNDLGTISGVKYLVEYEAISTISESVPIFVKIIKDKSNLRRLILAASEIMRLAYNSNQSASSIIDSAEEAILEVRNNLGQVDNVSLQILVRSALNRLEDLVFKRTKMTGVRSGFKALDNITSGFQPSELIIIAGRPSMGKTAFILNIAAQVAINDQVPVAFFSLEMSSDQLVSRLIGAESRIDLSLIKRGELEKDKFAHVIKVAGTVGQAPIFIDETPSLSITDLRNKCRRMVNKHKAQLIIIDYLQLMSSTETYENKATEIGEISKGLKNIARELKVPVIALSQLNRGVEARTDKRPMMSDLRESGAIEQDADVIAFLYREEYYLRDKTPEDKIGIAEVIIAKNRNGPTGVLELRFFNNITRFVDLDKNHHNFD